MEYVTFSSSILHESLLTPPLLVVDFLLSFFSNKVAEQYQSFIMLIFGSILFFAGCFVYFFAPELKGLSLEEVDELFESKVPAWKSSKWTPSRRQIDYTKQEA
jgi:MFS transporter, SP family, sugar:H+ symporter